MSQNHSIISKHDSPSQSNHVLVIALLAAGTALGTTPEGGAETFFSAAARVPPFVVLKMLVTTCWSALLFGTLVAEGTVGCARLWLVPLLERVAVEATAVKPDPSRTEAWAMTATESTGSSPPESVRRRFCGESGSVRAAGFGGSGSGSDGTFVALEGDKKRLLLTATSADREGRVDTAGVDGFFTDTEDDDCAFGDLVV